MTKKKPINKKKMPKEHELAIQLFSEFYVFFCESLQDGYLDYFSDQKTFLKVSLETFLEFKELKENFVVKQKRKSK